MALTEKQALIVGIGGLAALVLVKHKGSVKPVTRASAAKGPAGIVSSAQRPSTNLATLGGRATLPQPPSIVGVRPPAVTQTLGVLSAVQQWINTVLKNQPKSTAPNAPGSAPKPSSGGGLGGGSSSGSSGRQSGQIPPGANPWSAGGDFTGRSLGVTGAADPSQYYAIDPETGQPYPDQGPQQPADGSLNADGTTSDDPPAMTWDGGYYAGAVPAPDSGPVDDGSYDPGTNPPLDSAAGPGVPDFTGPIQSDTADYGDDGSSYYYGGDAGGGGGGADDASVFMDS